MDIKLSGELQAASWECIPDTGTLTEYLDREDLMELSKCCKVYRNQLERPVLENLSLQAWKRNNREICEELVESKNVKKVLEFLETDLGSKLKFVNRFTLYCEVDFAFAEVIVKLLPNIKTLKLICGLDNEYPWLGEGLATILLGMKNLEHVYHHADKIGYNSGNKQYFPKWIKSIKFNYYYYPIDNEYELTIHNTIDASYTNLHYLNIVSHRMLQNLSSGMPNLQEVKLEYIDNFDSSKLVAFLKANPQLRKLTAIEPDAYNDEVFKTILSSKCIEHWRVGFMYDEEIAIYNLPSNYSIKYLHICDCLPDFLALKIINACKNLETLDFKGYDYTERVDWSKFERKVNIMKISSNSLTLNNVSKIDTDKLFNQVRIYTSYSIDEDIDRYSIVKLKNYELIYKTLKYCIFKLINKTN